MLIELYPVCQDYGYKIFGALYNKFESLEFRPNLTLAEDPYRGSLLAKVLYLGLISRSESVGLTRAAILYGDDIVYSLFVLRCVMGGDFLENHKYLLSLLNKIYPHIDSKNVLREITALGLKDGYFSRRLFTTYVANLVFSSFVSAPDIPIVVANKRRDLLIFINGLEPLNEPEVSRYIALTPGGAKIDLRAVQFDYKYADELRKSLGKDNLFKYVFDNIYSCMYTPRMILKNIPNIVTTVGYFRFGAVMSISFAMGLFLKIRPGFYEVRLQMTLPPFREFILDSETSGLTDMLIAQSRVIARFIAVFTITYLANGLISALTRRKADLKNLAIVPENMLLSPTLHGDMLEDRRAEQKNALTICFDTLAKKRDQMSMAAENGLLEEIMDYSIGERLPDAFKYSKS